MTYFLDTNIISYILNGNTNVKKRIEELILQDNDISVPIFAYYEKVNYITWRSGFRKVNLCKEFNKVFN